MLSMQRIDVYDIGLNRIGMLLSWISLLWEEQYNTLGSFQLEVQKTDENARLLRPWTYYKIDTSDCPMISTYVELRDNKIVLRGFPATYILQKRISTEVIAYKNAESALMGLVGGMTSWENFGVGESKGITARFNKQISDKSILEYCQEIGQETDMGFYVRKQGKQLLFECYKPELNENLKMAERYGNLANLVYIVNENNAYNVAVVAGAEVSSAPIRRYYERISYDTDVETMEASATYTASDFSTSIDDSGHLMMTYPYTHQGIADPRLNENNVQVKIDTRYTVEVGDTGAEGYLRRELYVDAKDIQPNEG